MDKARILETIAAVGKRLGREKDYLTALDQPIGDSDHGINLDRGFRAVAEKLPSMENKDAGGILKEVGMILVSTVGGASGPLYGSAFLKAGMAMAGKEAIDIEDFLLLMEAAVEAVKARGKAQVEEATMLDAMVPSLAAMREAAGQGKSAGEILDLGVTAAFEGAEHTKDLIATKGRASYVGERGLGHKDPGAVSYAMLLETVRDMAAK